MMNLLKRITLGCLLVLSLSAYCEGLMEKKLNYELNESVLEKGGFQYFYALLKEVEFAGKNEFQNLTPELSRTPEDEILKAFMPLDVKKLWDSKDQHYLAVAKFSFLLPIPLQEIREEVFTSQSYLQSTLPKYKVTKKGDFFHVGGSLITPDFDLMMSFLKPSHPYVEKLPLLNKEILAQGKVKAIFMHQENFGRVIFFKTAKAANALIIYSEYKTQETLVTQYILSNVINVPTKEMIRKGMLENLSDVVDGSRKVFSDTSLRRP